MAFIREQCPECGSETEVLVGQSVSGNELVWHKSYACPNCQTRIEEDDSGAPPDDVREAILQQEGEWCLVLDVTNAERTGALKMLRQVLGLSLSEIGDLKQRLPGRVTTGTKGEVTWLMTLLQRQGFDCRVVPVGEVASPPPGKS